MNSMPASLYLQKLTWLNPSITTDEAILLIVLAEYLNNDPRHRNYRKAWPSYTTIMTAAKFRSRPTVSKNVKSLVKKGYLAVAVSDKQDSNVYAPNWGNLRAACPGPELDKLEERPEVAALLSDLQRDGLLGELVLLTEDREVVYETNQGGLRDKPEVVYETNQGGLRDKLDRPRERPLEPFKERPKTKEKAGVLSEQIQGLAPNDDIKNLIESVDQKMRERKNPITTWDSSTGDPKKIIAGFTTLISEITITLKTKVTADHIYQALENEEWRGMRALSWGMIFSRSPDSDQKILRKFKKILTVIVDVSKPFQSQRSLTPEERMFEAAKTNFPWMSDEEIWSSIRG